MADFAPFVLFATTVTLAFGLAVATLGYRAYRRTDRAGLRSLSAALVLVVAGAAVGAADQLLGVDADVAGLSGSVVTAAGFVVLVVSLYGGDGPRPGRNRHDGN